MSNENMAAKNYKKLCELAPAFMNGDEDYTAFTSPRDVTRLVELQRMGDETHIEMTETVQSGGHCAISDIIMSLLPKKAEGLLLPVDLFRDGWDNVQSAEGENGMVDQEKEDGLSEFLSGWLDNIRECEFTQIPLQGDTEDSDLSKMPQNCLEVSQS